MTGRHRRPVPRVDNRRRDYVGMEDDSSEATGSEDDQILDGDSSAEDNVEYSSEEEEETINWEQDLLLASDGTQWTRRPRGQMPSWRTSPKNFHDGPRGEANRPGNEGMSKSDLFSLFLTDAVQQDICRWTNAHGRKLVQSWNQTYPRKIKTWTDLTPMELKAFIGLILLSGVERAKQKPWHELWKKHEAIRLSPFPATMSRTRFYDIMRALRFDDAEFRHQESQEKEKKSEKKKEKKQDKEKVSEKEKEKKSEEKKRRIVYYP